MHAIGTCNASLANISGEIVAFMDHTPHDADQVAVWQTLLAAQPGDHMTVDEVCAVASAAAGQRVDWWEAHRMIADLHAYSGVTRIVVQRTGQPRGQAYALTDAGRRRVQRLLHGGRGDQRKDVLGGVEEGSA